VARRLRSQQRALDLGRRKIDEQLRLVPLFKEHVVSGKPKRKKSFFGE
jgi:hypothetical protein